MPPGDACGHQGHSGPLAVAIGESAIQDSLWGRAQKDSVAGAATVASLEQLIDSRMRTPLYVTVRRVRLR